MTNTPSGPEIERVLGRVVVGYRVVSGVWVAILGIITLAGSNPPDQPGVVIGTVLGVAVWALLTLWLHATRPGYLRSWIWLGVDVVATIWVLFSSDAAGVSATFYGGYPMSTIFMGVYAFAMIGGLATAAALSIATIIRIIESSPSDLAIDAAAVLIYLFGGVLAGWAVGVIRRSDRLRRDAEEALTEEQSSRVRAEERADMAAHLHDSVLQTLAMIQRTNKPEETVTLARRQERELRSWLFGDAGSTDESFAAAVRAMTAEIEELFPVQIQTIVVGDTDLDARMDALVKAGREASVNAARHSGVNEFSVYAEIRDRTASLFVRDRGAGFDSNAVPSDRKGIAESILNRMERAGGRAAIRSRIGEGTEVVLEQEVQV